MSKHFFKTLKIENFRGIKSLEIDDLARVNLFVGENNCGKTTVLEAALLLAYIGNPYSMIGLENRVRNIVLTESSDFGDFFHGRNHEAGIDLSCVQGRGKRNLKILPMYGNLPVIQTSEASSTSTPGGSVKRVPKLGIETPVERQDMIGLEYKFTVADHSTGKSTNHKTQTYWTEPGSAQFTNDFDAKHAETMVCVYCAKTGYNQSFVDQMLNKKQKDVLLSILQSIEPTIQDIRTGSRGFVSVDIGLDSFIPINLLGGGTNRVLNILSVVNWTADGLVMVDEVEDGLHVNALENLWRLILDHSEKSNVQIFLTTHSDDAIKTLRGALSEKLLPESVACYRLVKFPEGKIRAYRYSAEQLGQALDSDTDIRL